MTPRVRDAARDYSRRGPLAVAFAAKAPERLVPLLTGGTQPSAYAERGLKSGHGGPLLLGHHLLALRDSPHPRGVSLRDAVVILAGLLKGMLAS